MISLEGKAHIKRYLAGWTPAIAASIGLGLGHKVEAVGDTGLQFEIVRFPITLVSYDFVTDKLIFKAPVPQGFGGTVYEVGLFSQQFDAMAGSYGSRILSTFDSDSEEWLNPSTGVESSYTTALARIGGDALLLNPSANGTATSALGELGIDLSGNSSADKFSLAYNVGSNVSSVYLRFKTDDSNYYQYTMASPTGGYQIISLTKGAAVVTGAPKWSDIQTLEVVVNATAGGAASVTFDGLRVEDTDTANPNYVMVSRELLSIPFTIVEGQVQEVEFALDVAV